MYRIFFSVIIPSCKYGIDYNTLFNNEISKNKKIIEKGKALLPPFSPVHVHDIDILTEERLSINSACLWNSCLGQFVIMKSSNAERRKTGIIKRNLTANGDLACLTFWYRSLGYRSNILKVYVEANGQKLSSWNSLLDTSTDWKRKSLAVHTNFFGFSVRKCIHRL